jgi:hypothetical protein
MENRANANTVVAAINRVPAMITVHRKRAQKSTIRTIAKFSLAAGDAPHA